jgi:NAD(P)-dependent dehydrogenase (short-subunit alcohol dehydrogenase family)
MRLKNKVVIVTGSTTGIGEAIARRFVAEGAKVTIHGRDEQRGREIADELAPNSTLVLNDLIEPESADQLVRETLKAFGRIDGIVNNAALPKRATLEQTDAKTFDYIINLNLRAPLLLIRAAISHLKKSNGSVLNIGSVNAYCGASNLLPYSISKGGLMTMTRNLADALCYDRVRINQVNVGWTLTANEDKIMRAGGLPEGWWKHPPRHSAPSGSLLMPETVAAAAVYWIGDESRPISGSVLELDQYPIIGRNTVKEKE